MNTGEYNYLAQNIDNLSEEEKKSIRLKHLEETCKNLSDEVVKYREAFKKATYCNRTLYDENQALLEVNKELKKMIG